MLTAILMMLAAEASGGATARTDEPDPKSMSRSEIRTHNAALNKTHPYYIRCVKSADTGSLIARNYSCRTNHQWDVAERTGNENARETLEAMKGKAINSN